MFEITPRDAAKAKQHAQTMLGYTNIFRPSTEVYNLYNYLLQFVGHGLTLAQCSEQLQYYVAHDKHK